MLDLETMGTGSNALITTVSIVQFDLKTGIIGKELELGIDWKEQIKHNAVMDADTIQWWLKQDADAIKDMMRLPQYKVTNVIAQINGFFIDTDLDLRNVTLWGNGSVFDNVILRNLYERHNAIFPIPFWCDNDVRTLVNISDINTKDFKFKGIKHRGIDDCKHQINYCHHAYKMYKGS